MEKERNLSEQKYDYLTFRMKWTEENGECKMLILLFMKLAFSSNPRGLLYQANQVSDQAQKGEELAV